MANPFGFDKAIENLKRVKAQLPTILASRTRSYFLRSWDNQGYNGGKWPEVERRKAGTKANKYATSAARNRAILVGNGSTKLKKAVNNSLDICTFDMIKFTVKDVKYAKVHNEGLKAGRGAGFRMPQRQFMPIEGQTQPEDLTRLQVSTIKEFVDNIFKH